MMRLIIIIVILIISQPDIVAYHNIHNIYNCTKPGRQKYSANDLIDGRTHGNDLIRSNCFGFVEYVLMYVGTC